MYPKNREVKSGLQEKFYLCLRIIEVVAIVSGVIFSVIQIRDVRDMQSAELMLNFNQTLNTEKNSEIAYAIEENQPLLVQNKGKFNPVDIDNFLGVFELISTTYRAGLITNDMMYDAFSSIIVKTYDNSEIQDYLNTIRKDDSSYYNGFEDLAKAIKVANQ